MTVSGEIVDQVQATCEDAAAANLATASRRGNLIQLDHVAADDVMIAADLHGHRVNFDRLVRIADLDAHPRRHLIMQEVCHGGPLYPNEFGCMSHLMLEDVMHLKTAYPDRFHFLISNHELAEMTSFPITKANRMLNVLFRCGMLELYGQEADRLLSAYIGFISTCPLAVRLDTGVFICHSAPENVDRHGFDSKVFDRPLKDEDFVPTGPVFELVWGRDFRQENADAFASLVGANVLIHGHEPCLSGFSVPNDKQIILDCCGRRACYLILPLDREYSQTEMIDLIGHIS
jgi:hypothetical protein